MSYVRPVVQVYQGYAKTSNPAQSTKLIPCIVGPCYHVLGVDTDPILTRVGILSSSGNVDIDIPNNKYGAVVDPVSIIVKISEARINLGEFTSSGIESFKFLKFTESEFPDAVTEGCLVSIYDGATAVKENVTVGDIDRVNFKLSLNNVVTSTSTSLTVHVYMPIVDFYIKNTDTDFFEFYVKNLSTGVYELAGSTHILKNSAGINLVDGLDNIITLGTGNPLGLATFDEVAKNVTINKIEATINGEDYDVQDGIVYIGYRSFRTDLTKVRSISDMGEVTGLFGSCNADNPLGLGVMLTFANTDKVPVKCIGVKSDDLEGYEDARNKLTNEENVYSIVPLTQDVGILGLFGSHVNNMSTPEVGRWRMCITNTKLSTTKTIVSSTGEVQLNGTAKTLLFSEDGNFLQNGVQSGDTVTLNYSNTTEYKYIVDTVVTDDLIELDTPVEDAFATDGTLYVFSITTPLDNTAQAEEIAAVSNAYNSRRIVNVWPDLCEVDGETVPGYYLGCVVAGLIGGLYSHQGLTRLSVAGITKLEHSNTYFSADELDIIAGGGTCIFEQDGLSAAPVIRHQLSTDMSTIEFREISFTKNYDYVSYLCKDVLNEYIGQYNITPITLVMLGTTMSSLLDNLKLASVPKFGAPVLDYNIKSIEQVENNRGRVNITVNILFPYALNEIGLYLWSI